MARLRLPTALLIVAAGGPAAAGGCAPALQHVPGYGAYRFEADPVAGQVRLVGPEGVTILAEGAELGAPRFIVPNGGQLVVGTDTGLHTVNLRTHERKTLAGEIGAVVGLVMDHQGYLVAATRGADPVVSVTPQGKVFALNVPEGTVPMSLRYDEATRTLYVGEASTGATLVFDYLELIGEDPELWARRDARPMKPFTVQGVGLTGGEYWPNRGAQPTRYPDDVLWGFYPEEGVVFEGEAARGAPTKAAMRCAQIAYDRLFAWVSEHHALLAAAAARRDPPASRRFYLWVNDYSEADDPFPHPMRPAKFWYWQRKPPVPGRIPGYWKWESTVLQNGACTTPDPRQIQEYLSADDDDEGEGK